MFMNKEERELTKVVKLMSAKGKSKDYIKDLLLKAGWDEGIIKKIFDRLEKKEVEIVIPLRRKKEVVNQQVEQTEEKKPEGIKGQLDRISKTLDVITEKDKAERKLKKKNFKLPMKVKGRLKKLAVQGKVQVMLLQRTRNIAPVVGEIKEGMLMVGDSIYDGSVDATWLWRGKYPTHIVPEWDLKPLTPDGIDNVRNSISPLSPSELYKDCIANSRSAEPQKIILRAVEAKQNKLFKKPISAKSIIIAVVVTLIVAAILFSGGIT